GAPARPAPPAATRRGEHRPPDRGQPGPHPHVRPGHHRLHGAVRRRPVGVQPRLPRAVRQGSRQARPGADRALLRRCVPVAGAVVPVPRRGAVPAHGVVGLVIVPLLLGALVGLGAVASWRLLFPSPPPLQAAVDRLQRRNQLRPNPAPDQPDGISEFLGRTIGASLCRVLRSLGLRLDSLEPDLRLVGRSLDQHLAQKVVLAFFGLALPAVVTAVWAVGGFSVPLTFPAGVGLVLGVFFFFAPDISLRSETEERRKAFKRALGSFLDLVVISLAGGRGVETARRAAARVGRGWAFGQLRNALEVTALAGKTPWAALARLGGEVGV